MLASYTNYMKSMQRLLKATVLSCLSFKQLPLLLSAFKKKREDEVGMLNDAHF